MNYKRLTRYGTTNKLESENYNMNEEKKKEDVTSTKKLESEILNCFTNNVNVNSELLSQVFDTFDKMNKRMVIKDFLTFGIFILLLIILYLF